MSQQTRIAARRVRRAFRVRKALRGTAERPRISVHRTHLHIYAQMIDDEAGRTLCEASSLSLDLPYGGNAVAAKAVGEALGKKAKDLKVERACFDRGAARYHGRVKALADAVRAAGVKF
jgi:large subunit ribosomal protein L18